MQETTCDSLMYLQSDSVEQTLGWCAEPQVAVVRPLHLRETLHFEDSSEHYLKSQKLKHKLN